MKQSTKFPVRVLAIVVVVLLVLQCMGIDVGLTSMFQLIWVLLWGWIPFISRVQAEIQVRSDLVISAAIYALLLLVGSHLFCSWLYREMASQSTSDATAPKAKFRVRWTISGFLLVVLMFCAGIAMIGVAHQVTWLARSPKPMFLRGVNNAYRVRCASNLRQIGLACLMYANAHEGKFPDEISMLVEDKDIDLPADVLTCPEIEEQGGHTSAASSPTTQQQELKESDRHLSYLYFGRGGRTNQMTSEEVLALEPPSNHRNEGSNVLFGDGHVEWLTEPALGELLVKHGFERIEYEER